VATPASTGWAAAAVVSAVITASAAKSAAIAESGPIVEPALGRT
jgi:hypothetical protein